MFFGVGWQVFPQLSLGLTHSFTPTDNLAWTCFSLDVSLLGNLETLGENPPWHGENMQTRSASVYGCYEVSLEKHEDSMGKANYSQSLAKSRGSADPKRQEFIRHLSVSLNKPSEYRRQDFLQCVGAKNLKPNHFIDTAIEKAGFSGCLEHNSVIWHQIQMLGRKKGNSTSCSSIWPTPLGQFLIPSWGWLLSWVLTGAYTNNNFGKTLLPRFASLPHNTQLYFNMAAIGSRHHGGVHHLPLGLYYGNGAHFQSHEKGFIKRLQFD